MCESALLRIPENRPLLQTRHWQELTWSGGEQRWSEGEPVEPCRESEWPLKQLQAQSPSSDLQKDHSFVH